MNNKISPKISVVMPVYNGKEYLALAVESILRQTFADFEFIIINDGSTDNSADIAASYEDPRIKLLHNDKNLGLIPSFNRGLENSRGEYIARMDADDIAFPDRFKKQVAFLDDHPDIALCGSWA
jgi:glycosyltransferase involved in cell wall biosynthesis